MASYVTCLITLLLLYLTSTLAKKSSRTTLMMVPKKLNTCKNMPNNGLEVQTFNVNIYNKRTYAFNTNISYSRGWQVLSKLTVDIIKCTDNVETLNTCEHFQRWVWYGKDACAFLENKNAFYYELLRNVEPAPIICPLVPDVYRYTNCTLDVNLLQVMPFPFEGNLWLIDANMWDADGRPNCFHMGVNFLRTRV